jgi:hypothetical protein
VSSATRRGSASRIGRAAIGERLGGFIYGTIVVLSVIVAGAKAYPHSPGRVAAMVFVTTVVLWLAHVYAHGLAHSVARGEHLSRTELLYIARREVSIIEAGVPPLGALLLGALGVLSTQIAVWGALGLGLAVLAAQGFVFARIEGLSRVGTMAVVAANLGLGLLLIGLKLLLGH